MRALICGLASLVLGIGAAARHDHGSAALGIAATVLGRAAAGIAWQRDTDTTIAWATNLINGTT